MKGSQLIARFAFGPNCLDYCGNKRDSEKIYLHACNGNRPEEEMRKIFSGFTGMSAYLELIASESGKEPLDYEVAEAYWLGNGLLGNVSMEAWKETILTKFVGNGKLSKAQAKAYAGKVSGSAVPHHSFHVMAVFTLGGRLEPTIQNIDYCRVPWGKILEEKGNSFVVEYKPLVPEGQGFGFGKAVEKEVLNSLAGGNEMLVSASEGETIAFHWGFACKVLEERERRSLENCVSKNMRALEAKSLL